MKRKSNGKSEFWCLYLNNPSPNPQFWERCCKRQALCHSQMYKRCSLFLYVHSVRLYDTFSTRTFKHPLVKIHAMQIKLLQVVVFTQISCECIVTEGSANIFSMSLQLPRIEVKKKTMYFCCYLCRRVLYNIKKKIYISTFTTHICSSWSIFGGWHLQIEKKEEVVTTWANVIKEYCIFFVWSVGFYSCM